MKTIKELIVMVCIAAFIIGAFVVIPYGHYERTISDDGPFAEVYSEHVVDYPTKNENIFGFSMIVGSLIIGLLTSGITKKEK